MLGAAADVILRQVTAIQQHLALLRGLEPADQLCQGRFARAVAPHNADHLAFADGKADVMQGALPLGIAKAKAAHFQQVLRCGGGFRQRQGVEPLVQAGGIGIIQHHGVHMGRALFRCDGNARIAHGRQVQRLPDAVFGQHMGGQQLVRAQVSQNSTLIDQDDAVHIAPQHILQPVLNDQHGGIGLVLDLVDQLNGLLAGGRVQAGKGFIKHQNFNLIHHNARQADALLLPAGKLMRGMVQAVFNAHQLCGMAGDLVHFLLGNTAVFQRKGNVLAHRQANELAVRILQHRAHMGRKLKNAAVGRIHTVYRQAAGAFAGVGKRVQPVDAGRQRAFAAAGRPGDQHTLTGVDIQVDIMQRRLFLRTILEGEVFE